MQRTVVVYTDVCANHSGARFPEYRYRIIRSDILGDCAAINGGGESAPVYLHKCLSSFVFHMRIQVYQRVYERTSEH